VIISHKEYRQYTLMILAVLEMIPLFHKLILIFPTKGSLKI